MPRASSLGVLLFDVGDKLGTVTRRVSYLISLFIGGLTSIVRTGPRGRPLPLKSWVVETNDNDCEGITVKAVLLVASDADTKRDSFMVLSFFLFS